MCRITDATRPFGFHPPKRTLFTDRDEPQEAEMQKEEEEMRRKVEDEGQSFFFQKTHQKV